MTATTPPPPQTYGFIGLGSLGGSLVQCLVRAGFQVLVYDRDAAAMAACADLGAVRAASARDVAKGSEAVFTCLPSPAVSEAVLSEILPAMAPGSTWLECSTVDREDILRFEQLCQARGVHMLECPVTGGVHLAQRGAISVLIGGERALFDAHKRALEAISARAFYMGPLGSASVIKVITNMLAFIHLVADGEALMLAKRAGLDLKTAWEAIAASSGTSFVHETEGQLILNGSYDVAFTLALAQKDIGIAQKLAEEVGAPLDLAHRVSDAFDRAVKAYGSEAQSPMVVKLLEEATGSDLRAEGFPARLE